MSDRAKWIFGGIDLGLRVRACVRSGRVCIQLILLSCLVLMGGVILDLNTNRPHFPRPRKLMVFFVKHRWGRPPKWEFPLGRKNKNGVTPHKKKLFMRATPPWARGIEGSLPIKSMSLGMPPNWQRGLGESWSGPNQHSHFYRGGRGVAHVSIHFYSGRPQ